MIRPEHVMTHDNTGPVVSKCVVHLFALLICKIPVMIGSSRLELHEYKILLSLSLPLTMTFKTDPRRTLPSTP